MGTIVDTSKSRTMSCKGVLAFLLCSAVVGLTGWGVYVGSKKLNTDKIFPISQNQTEMCLNNNNTVNNNHTQENQPSEFTCWVVRNFDMVINTCTWYIFINIMALVTMALDKCLACTSGEER